MSAPASGLESLREEILDAIHESWVQQEYNPDWHEIITITFKVITRHIPDDVIADLLTSKRSGGDE